jgi:glutamate racemase
MRASEPANRTPLTFPPDGIAVFDSGVGGLTVAQQLMRRLPSEDLIYFGDTARVPYGTKSPETIARFAIESSLFLMRFRPKILVIACNTVSAVALEALREIFAVTFCGVVYPGARAAVNTTTTGKIAVIATQATIESRAYEREIEKLDPKAKVVSRACPLFVPLAEEGRQHDDPVVLHAVRGYLNDLLTSDIDTLVLGCTHYPILKEAIQAVLGDKIKLVDSSYETARTVEDILAVSGKVRREQRQREVLFTVSDNPVKFKDVGERFLGCPLDKVRLVSAEEYYQFGHYY